MRVNLLDEQKNVYSIDWFTTISVIVFIILLLTISFHYYSLLNQYNMVKSKIENYKDQSSLLLQKKDEYYQLQEKINKLTEYKAEMKKYQYFWNDIIKELGYVTPSKVQLKKVDIEKNILKISGISEDSQYVMNFINNLKDSPYLSKAAIIKLEKKEEIIFKIEAIIS